MRILNDKILTAFPVHYSPKYNTVSPEIKITEHKRYIDIARSQSITLVHFPHW